MVGWAWKAKGTGSRPIIKESLSSSFSLGRILGPFFHLHQPLFGSLQLVCINTITAHCPFFLFLDSDFGMPCFGLLLLSTAHSIDSILTSLGLFG